jgi:hypothetical protein
MSESEDYSTDAAMHFDLMQSLIARYVRSEESYVLPNSHRETVVEPL